MLGINSSTCRTEKCVGAELRSKVNFLNEIEIAADGLCSRVNLLTVSRARVAPFVNAQTIVFALLRRSVDNPGDASVLVVQTPNWYALNSI